MNIAWAAKEAVKTGVNLSPMEALLQASLIVQITLLILVTLSIVSWAIIFTKKKQFDALQSANEDFMEHFWKASSLDEMFQKVDKYKLSPVAAVFKSGFVELRRIAESNLGAAPKAGVGSTTPRLVGLDNLSRALRKATDNEVASLEARLNFLATTGSTGPFIGLFGTVWGIMNAFHKIGQTGSASLAVVAPGISEALITTAIGLAAAIPAVIGYNHFVTCVRKEELEISNFTSDFLNLVKRDFFREE